MLTYRASDNQGLIFGSIILVLGIDVLSCCYFHLPVEICGADLFRGISSNESAKGRLPQLRDELSLEMIRLDALSANEKAREEFKQLEKERDDLKNGFADCKKQSFIHWSLIKKTEKLKTFTYW